MATFVLDSVAEFVIDERAAHTNRMVVMNYVAQAYDIRKATSQALMKETGSVVASRLSSPCTS